MKDESDGKPAWADQKTKAGKDRKRLPLACIACRRKKIRCSGEKPACNHCTRSRMPCVYKVTARKAAPRTDYMAMLDRRLKRMEDRVIKIIPKEEYRRTAAIPRAIVRPTPSGHFHAGQKRGVEEAFGTGGKDLVTPKASQPTKGEQVEGCSTTRAEGSEYLPSKELQEHLSEVFFDYLYGQAYHLMHRPSYMRRLRAGTLPPVILLAVCAVAARFSNHPQINSEPKYLRGEEWAGPVRDIVLKRYDEPNIAILTVTVILALHEFGTCHSGRSWMFCGMATRMAYALQLHRELDHDPLGRKNAKKAELTFIDREIRRRTMWACFTMDRFTASGTERPMFVDEDDIEVRLPIKESNFLMELSGSTETLLGEADDHETRDAGHSSDLRDNMGVTAYMIRTIALYGRVIKYMNLGGRDRDKYPIWDDHSHFKDLKDQLSKLKCSLPPDLENTPDNLQNHASERLANQFLFLHIGLYQIMLFLHRFAIPSSPGADPPKDVPKSFLTESISVALDAANQISILIAEAYEYHTVAPFVGYCAFLSSTVHVWAMFSGNPSLKENARKRLSQSVDFLNKTKTHWGVFHFMVDNLRDICKQYSAASSKLGGEKAKADAVFQFGDWFKEYPHGVIQADAEKERAQIKSEPEENASLSHKSDLQTVEHFVQTQSPPNNHAQSSKAKKPSKTSARPAKRGSQPSQPVKPDVENHSQEGSLPITIPDSQAPMTPSPFTPSHPLFFAPNNPYMDMNQFASQPHTSLLPQLDRRLVYGAYAGNEPSASTSASALNAMANGHDYTPVDTDGIWEGSPPLNMDLQQFSLGEMGPNASAGYMGDPSTSAWFMPFNLNPPESDLAFNGPN